MLHHNLAPRGETGRELCNSLGMEMNRIEHETRLAKKIEAGLLAQDALDTGEWPAGATAAELRTLVAEGFQAKDDLVLGHLGLVSVIAAEASRQRAGQFSDLFQEGCVGIQQAVLTYDWRKGPFGPYAAMWIRTAVRRSWPRSWVPVENLEIPDAAPVTSIDRRITHDRLARVLQLIPPAERRVLRLRTGWQGERRTLHEIAGEMGLTVSKVRSLEKSGVELVRRCWELGEAA